MFLVFFGKIEIKLIRIPPSLVLRCWRYWGERCEEKQVIHKFLKSIISNSKSHEEIRQEMSLEGERAGT
jgi:hypothetical protein